MCGRFTLRASPAEIARHFDVALDIATDVDIDPPPELKARFNVAPGQEIATVRAGADARVLELRRWGLVPHWAADPSVGHRMINARSETAAQRPAFRDAFRSRRCLVPADGFFEWASANADRQPYLIARQGEALFGIAGLFEAWSGPGGEVIESCTLLTTQANAKVAVLHDRMPVIVGPDDYDAWLDPDAVEPEGLQRLLAPCPDAWLGLRPVSRRVNDVRHDDAGCIAPAPEPPRQQELF